MNDYFLNNNLFFIRNKKEKIKFFNLFLKNKKINLPQNTIIDLSKITNNIFVINLEKDKDKKNEMEKKFFKYGIKNYEFITGIIPENEFIYLFNKISKDKDPIGRINYMGELGCFLSHKKIWKRVLTERIKNCIIFEDDIFFHKNFQEIINKNIDIFNNFDVVKRC